MKLSENVLQDGRIVEWSYEEDFHNENWIYTKNSDDEVFLKRYTGSSHSVEIPECIDNHPVVGLDKKVFENYDIEEIIFAESSVISEIPDSMCSGMVLLKKVYLSKDITKIGDSAFSNCSSLSDINVPEKLGIVGAYAFYNTAIVRPVISDNTYKLGECAFANCRKMKCYILFPASISVVERGTFKGSGVGAIDMSHTHLKYIPDCMCFECENLGMVILPSGTDHDLSIDEFAFADCQNLCFVKNSQNIASVFNFGFAGCTELKSIRLNNVKTLGKHCFSGTISNDMNITVYLPEKTKDTEQLWNGLMSEHINVKPCGSVLKKRVYNEYKVNEYDDFDTR